MQINETCPFADCTAVRQINEKTGELLSEVQYFWLGARVLTRSYSTSPFVYDKNKEWGLPPEHYTGICFFNNWVCIVHKGNIIQYAYMLARRTEPLSYEKINNLFLFVTS